MTSGLDFPAYAVACGEEGSDPVVLHEGQVFRVDQNRSSNRLEHLGSDPRKAHSSITPRMLRSAILADPTYAHRPEILVHEAIVQALGIEPSARR